MKKIRELAKKLNAPKTKPLVLIDGVYCEQSDIRFVVAVLRSLKLVERSARWLYLNNNRYGSWSDLLEDAQNNLLVELKLRELYSTVTESQLREFLAQSQLKTID